MKKIFIFCVLSIFLSGNSFAFNDIEFNWYKNSILELKELGIVNGFDDGSFMPEDDTTRAEILKIILSSAEVNIAEPEESCFSDISLSMWQAKYVCSGTITGITKGYDDGTFKPNSTVTVLETLAFSLRAFDIELPQVKEEDEEWYKRYQDFAHENNIIPIHSYTVNTLISRGQAADIIYKMKLYSDKQEVNYQSIGCEVNPSLQSGEYTINVGGSSREYLLYVPSGMKKGKEMNLLVAFHGRTNSNEMVRDYMQLGGGRYGYKQNDFIVAYPAGMGAGPYSWSQYENIELFDAIITEVSENLCVNRDAVFSVGHSLGSYMSNKVSCQRGDVIRAMAGVASSGFNGDCSGPAASLITHLPGDPLASYAGGQGSFKLKSEQNFCSSSETDTRIGDIKSCTQKTSCTTGNTVLFCNSYATYGNDQHSWPKEGSDDILDFFRDIDEYAE